MEEEQALVVAIDAARAAGNDQLVSWLRELMSKRWETEIYPDVLSRIIEDYARERTQLQAALQALSRHVIKQRRQA